MSSTRKHYKYEYLTSRWGGMQLRKEMDSRIEKWLSDFSEEEQQIINENKMPLVSTKQICSISR